MVRKNIFELLEEKYDVVKEMNKIRRIFNKLRFSTIQFKSELLTIEELFDLYCLPLWKQRGTLFSYKEIKTKLHLPQSFSAKGTAEILTTLEYYINVLFLVNVKCFKITHPRAFPPSEYHMLVSNIDILLEHINYEKLEFPKEEKVILIPKNPASTAVAEIAPKEIAFAILKYNHASLKGQLEEKRKLLVSIANEYEPLLDKPVEGFKDYFAKTTGLLNNLNIRHNNKAGKNKNEIVAKMSPEELESWYDELYQLLLFCVLCKDNYERKGKVSELLKI